LIIKCDFEKKVPIILIRNVDIFIVLCNEIGLVADEVSVDIIGCEFGSKKI